MPSDKMLSVAECFELNPGDDQNATWVNPGVQGVVRSIKQLTTKTRKQMWPCELADETGSAVIGFTMWTAPKFKEGDLIEIHGKGLRRTEYNGNAQITLGKETQVNVIGQSVHHSEQKERAAETRPSVNGTLPTISGQTVGMAMKESLALVGMARGGITGMDVLKDALFWEDVKMVAGAIIRISRSLEGGKLSPPPWPVRETTAAESRPADRGPATGTGATGTRQPAGRGQPQDERQAANLPPAGAPDEDVPW